MNRQSLLCHLKQRRLQEEERYWNCKIGVLQIYFGHEIPLQQGILQGVDTLHFEMSVTYEGVEPAEIDDRTLLTPFLLHQEDIADKY